MDLIIQHHFHGSIPIFGKQVFEEHNEMVRTLAKVECRELLEFELGDGWEELCEFLGKEVPDLDFPHVNERDLWRRSFGLGWNGRNLLFLGLPIICGVVGVCFAVR